LHFVAEDVWILFYRLENCNFASDDVALQQKAPTPTGTHVVKLHIRYRPGGGILHFEVGKNEGDYYTTSVVVFSRE
jgi:hypothetical protein